MKLYLAFILLFPLAGGLFNALFGRILPRRAGETVACTVIWGAFASALLAFLDFTAPVKIEYATWLSAFDFKAPITLYLDQLSISLTLMITFVCGLIHLYSVGYMKDDPSPARYFALLNIFVFAMLTLVLAENLPLLYLGWEGVGFCSYALIGFWYSEEKNATAGRKAFIVTRIGDTAFGIAAVWMFQLFGTVSISELNGMGFLMPGGVITALGILLLIGAAGKSAQLPLSVWLPDAMAGPTPVSAQIHAATMVTAGVYLLARMFPLIGSSAVTAGRHRDHRRCDRFLRRHLRLCPARSETDSGLLHHQPDRLHDAGSRCRSSDRQHLPPADSCLFQGAPVPRGGVCDHRPASPAGYFPDGWSEKGAAGHLLAVSGRGALSGRFSGERRILQQGRHPWGGF